MKSRFVADVVLRLSDELLEGIARRLLMQPGEALPFSVKELYPRQDGNLRDVLRELYDCYAAGEFMASKLHQRVLMR